MLKVKELQHQVWIENTEEPIFSHGFGEDGMNLLDICLESRVEV